MKRNGKRFLVGVLSLALTFGVLGTPWQSEAAKSKISVTKSMKLTVKQSKAIKVKGSYIKKKTFKSSNKKVATVSTKGKVTAKKPGKCKITVTVKYKKTKKAKKLSTKKFTCSVSVTNKANKSTASTTQKVTAAPKATPTPKAVTTVTQTPRAEVTPTPTPSLEPAPSIEPGDVDKDFSLTSLVYEDKDYMVEKDIDGSDHYMMELYGQESLRYLLPKLKSAEFKATYQDKEITDIEISKIQWHNDSYFKSNDEATGYYTFVLKGNSGNQQIERQISLSDYNEKLELCSLIDKQTGREYKAETVDLVSVTVPEGETLKDKFSKLSSDYTIKLSYKNKRLDATGIEDLTWSEEPYYSNGCDAGYYRFTADIQTLQGEVSQEFYLAEVYRNMQEIGPDAETFYTVTGTARDAENTAMSNIRLTFYKGESALDEYEYQSVDTDDKGNFSISLPAGVYSVGYNWSINGYVWNLDFAKNIITVGTEDITKDVQFNSIYKVSGTVKNQAGELVKDRYLQFYGKNILVGVQLNKKDGTYCTYLPEGEYTLEFYGFNLTDTLVVSNKSMVYDIQLKNICHVTGRFFLHDDVTACAEGIWFKDVKDGGEGGYYVSYEGEEYSAYLKANTSYICYIYLSGAVIKLGRIRTETKDETKNYTANVYEVSGVMKYTNGDRVKDEEIYLINGENKYYAWTAGNGNFSCFVPKGEYEVEATWKFRTKLNEKIVVENTDVTAHLQLPYYHIFGKVTNQGEKVSSTDLYIYDADGNWWMGDQINNFGEYSIYLPKGEYMLAAGLNKNGKKSLVVGDQDENVNVELGLYTVKGKLFAHGTQSFDTSCPYRIQFYDKNEKQMGTVYIGGKQEYEVYLPAAGTYTAKCGNQIVDTITVSNIITEKDIDCGLYHMSGIINRVEGVPWEKQYVSFRNATTDKHIISAYSDKNGKYDTYLPKGIYNIYYNENKIDSIEVTNEDLEKNIVCNYNKISGTLYQNSDVPWIGQEIELYDESGENYLRGTWADENGEYEFYVPKGTYSIRANNENVGTVTIESNDVEKDIVFNYYKISGKLYQNSDVLWTCQSIYLFDESGENHLYSGWANGYGEYEFYVPEGTYTIKVNVNGAKVGTVTVGSSDVTKDIVCNFYKLSGILYLNNDVAWTYQHIDLYDESGKNYECDTWTDSYGDYEFYVPEGTYTIVVNGLNVATVTVENSNVSKDIVCNFYKISGTLYQNIDVPLTGQEIYLYDGTGENYLYSKYTDENGTYVFYVAPGSYTIKVSDGMGNGEVVKNVEVTNEDVVKDINVAASE